MAKPPLPFEPDHALLEKALEHFGHDHFAFDTIGMHVEAIADGHAFVSMPLDPHLNNAKGNVQGGALFSLADLTGALADYDPSRLNTTVEGSIQYLSVPDGDVLYAHGYRLRTGKTLGYYRVDICNEEGRIVAAASLTFYHLKTPEVSRG